jgi:hypothetical protein
MHESIQKYSIPDACFLLFHLFLDRLHCRERSISHYGSFYKWLLSISADISCGAICEGLIVLFDEFSIFLYEFTVLCILIFFGLLDILCELQ